MSMNGIAPFRIDPKTGAAASTGTAFDLPAMCIVLALTALLVRGVKESSRSIPNTRIQFNSISLCLRMNDW